MIYAAFWLLPWGALWDRVGTSEGWGGAPAADEEGDAREARLALICVCVRLARGRGLSIAKSQR